MFFIIVSKNLQTLEVFLWTKMSLRCVEIGVGSPNMAWYDTERTRVNMWLAAGGCICPGSDCPVLFTL